MIVFYNIFNCLDDKIIKVVFWCSYTYTEQNRSGIPYIYYMFYFVSITQF